VAVAIARLEAEKRELEAASDLLKTLTAQLAALEDELKATEGSLMNGTDKRSKPSRKSATRPELQQQAQALLRKPPSPMSSAFPCWKPCARRRWRAAADG
jgi:peptidoglycan hydrolase CwlO-like protein